MNGNEETTLFQAKFLSLKQVGRWEFVSRNLVQPAVGIVALTDDQQIVLVEQHRPPVGHGVIELPAGLAGDIVGQEDEPLVEAAKRELFEETGYVAEHWTSLGLGYSSPGLTDEAIAMFLAECLQRTGAGGGDAHENIRVHHVALTDVLDWIANHGGNVDLKLLAGIYLAQQRIRQR